jgi:hypothetical protein
MLRQATNRVAWNLLTPYPVLNILAGTGRAQIPSTTVSELAKKP